MTAAVSTPKSHHRIDPIRLHAYAFAMLLWGPLRRWLAAWFVYSALIAWWIHAGQVTAINPCVFLLIMPTAMGLLMLLTAFIGADGNQVGKESGYPSHLLARPLTTSSLVLWPMLYAAITGPLAWIALVRLIIEPLGIPVPIVPLTAMVAAMIVWVQALTWSPFRIGYMRLLLLVPITAVLTFVGGLGAYAGLSMVLRTGVLLLMTAIAYPVALYGVGAARHGEGRNRSRGSRADRPRPVKHIVRHLPRFAAAARAQTWFDSYAGIRLSAVVTTIVSVPFVACAWTQPAVQPLMFGGWVFCIAVGLHIFTQGSVNKDQTLTSFYVIRPLTCTELAASLFRSAAASTLVTWAIFLPLVTAGCLISAHIYGEQTGVIAALQLHPLTFWIGAGLLFIILGFRSRVDGIAVGIAGRTWVTFVAAGLPLLLLSTVAFLRSMPASQIGMLLTILLCIAIILRMATLIAVVAVLVSMGLLSIASLMRIALAWCGAAALISLAIAPAVPVSAWITVSCVTLIMPGVRMALTPLALAWNRHR